MQRFTTFPFHRIGLLFLLAAVMQPATTLAHRSDGVFTRTIELKLRSGGVARWEKALADVVKIIRAEQLEKQADWLVYRKAPAEYFLVLNRKELIQVIHLPDLEETIAGLSSNTTFTEALATLRSTDYEITGDAVWHQHSGLSTAEGMSTATNPLAIVSEYSVPPARRLEFEERLGAYMNFLGSIRYLYPIEGFHGMVGKPLHIMSVVFPDTWASYHSGNDVQSFARARDQGAIQAELAERVFSIASAVREIRLEYAPELSP